MVQEVMLSACLHLRSAYFQQIEEDVKNHEKSIRELKASINSFQSTDMAELQNFHKHVESILEKLTDETQVPSTIAFSQHINNFLSENHDQ